MPSPGVDNDFDGIKNVEIVLPLVSESLERALM